MTRRLRVGPDLSLPDDAVTQTFVIFGKRGSGKSNTGVVLAEEMHRAGGQIIVLDPIGAWWGLKSSFDGTAAGLPVYVFGGQHGDLPLASTAGQLMAQVAIAHRIPMVLDLTGWSGAERARFVTAFARWLLEHNDRVPVHVFLEEADAFIPQRPYKGEEEMLGAMDRLIRWGRQGGIGATAITQRAAKINKDVTTQAEVLVAHRTIGPQDVAAIKAWIQYHASGDEQQEILSSLPTLPDGTAWVWSPDWLGILRQVAFRRRSTFDSASTPKIGEKRVQPKALAPVDIDALRDKLDATVEQAKANDPVALRRRILELERLQSRGQVDGALLEEALAEVQRLKDVPAQTIEVPVLNGQVPELRAAIGELVDAGGRLVEVATAISDAASVVGSAAAAIQSTGSSITAAIDRASAAPRPAAQPAIPAGERRAQGAESTPSGNLAGQRTGAPRSGTPVKVLEAAASRVAPAPAPAGEVGAPPLGKAERAILSALASYPTPLTREQLGFLAGYHPRSKGFVNALGVLRSSGLVTPGFPEAMTDAGRAALPPELVVDVGTVETWLTRFGRAERAILEALVALYPDAGDRDELARQAGFEHVRSKGFVNALGRLRGLGLVDGLALSSGFAVLLEGRP